MARLLAGARPILSRAQKPGEERLTMVTEPNFASDAGAGADGKVHLWVKPKDCGGVTYEMAPAHARKIANKLLNVAEIAENAVKRPN